MKRIFAALLSLCLLFPPLVQGRDPTLFDELRQTLRAHTDKAPATAQIETGFSPDGDAERLVLKIINSSAQSLRLAAYSFTSPKVVQALIHARRRGGDVLVVADDSNIKSKSGSAALNLLVNADIQARLNGEYAIHHDKYIIADGRHVQTGSFNYSKAAANSNSENVIVIWNNPELAQSYLRHWSSRFEAGRPYRSPY